jgi:hypothetical protein
MLELEEKEKQKAVFTEKIAREIYETEVCILHYQVVLCC